MKSIKDSISNLLNEPNYRKHIENSLKGWIENKRKLEIDPNHPDILMNIIGIIVTNAYYRGDRYNKFKEFLKRNNIKPSVSFFHSEDGIKFLNQLPNDTFFGKANEKLKEFFKEIREKTIKEWVEEGYNLINQGNYKEALKSLGKNANKGKDMLLRDLGFLDRVPIDTHEKRFLIRTGILHKFSTDCVDDYSQYHNALTNFCKEVLDGLSFRFEDKEYSISENPTIMDALIWFHCSGTFCDVCELNGRKICKKKEPNCSICGLKEDCLFYNRGKI